MLFGEYTLKYPNIPFRIPVSVRNAANAARVHTSSFGDGTASAMTSPSVHLVSALMAASLSALRYCRNSSWNRADGRLITDGAGGTFGPGGLAGPGGPTRPVKIGGAPGICAGGGGGPACCGGDCCACENRPLASMPSIGTKHTHAGRRIATSNRTAISSPDRRWRENSSTA